MHKTPPALATLAAATALALAAPQTASAATSQWNGGLFNPGVTAPNPLPSGDTLQIGSGAGKQFNGVAFTNDGTVVWLKAVGPSGPVQDTIGLTNASVTNNGLWDDQGANFLGSGGTFTNAGTYRKSGAGISYLLPGTLVNNGTIDVQQGRLVLPNSFVNAGTLIGSGEFSSSLLGLTNDGTVAPGAAGSVGTLSQVGIYRQGAGGVLAIDLTSSASFDRYLTTSGGIFLDGTLALNCLGACSFAIGDSLTILDGAGTMSGSFANVTLAGFGTGAFDVVYDVPGASVRLLVTEAVTAVPEPSSGVLLLAGVGWLAWRGRLRLAAAQR